MESKPVAPSMPDAEEVLPGRAEPVLEPGISHAVNGRPLLPPYPDHLDVANFAMGCFWGAEKGFWSIPGVWVTAVGYQGGTTPNPTYQEVRSGRTGHAEVVRVVFDPAVVSYEQLLRIFWESHDPTQGFRQGHDLGTQYRSAIYTYSPTQLETALTSRDLYQPVLTEAGFGAITTEIGPAPRLYFAEAYHQQYLVKVPNGYCPDHGTGIACPIGVAVKAE